MSSQQQVFNQLERLFQIFASSGGVIRPHSMLTGPSGSGKTFNIQRLARAHRIPFIEINGAQLTKEGLAGNSFSKALTPLATKGDELNIVFVDEIDKLFITAEDSFGVRDATIGVQNELLKILESETTDVIGDYGKYRQVNVSNTLFFFAGAFNNESNITLNRLREFGVRNEFLGRVSLVFNIAPPTVADLAQALQISPIFKQYIQMFPNYPGQQVYNYIMQIIAAKNNSNQLGMRMLTTLLHQFYLNDGNIPQQVIDDVFNIKPPIKIELTRREEQENPFQWSS